MKKQYVYIGAIAVLIIGSIVYFVRSETKLRDIKLNDTQNARLTKLDDEIKPLEDKLKNLYGDKASLAYGFAVSAGLSDEDMKKFKLDKKGDNSYHLIEKSPEELAKEQVKQ